MRFLRSNPTCRCEACLDYSEFMTDAGVLRRGESGCAQTGPGTWVVRSPCQDPLGIGCTCPVVDYAGVGGEAAWSVPHPDYRALQALGVERGACPACRSRMSSGDAPIDSEKGRIVAVKSSAAATTFLTLDSGNEVELDADRLAELRQHLGEDLTEISFDFALDPGSRRVNEITVDSLPEGWQPPFRPDDFTLVVADEQVRVNLQLISERWKEIRGNQSIRSGWDIYTTRAMRCMAGIAAATPQDPYHPDLEDAEQLRVFLATEGVPLLPFTKGLNTLRLPDR